MSVCYPQAQSCMQNTEQHFKKNRTRRNNNNSGYFYARYLQPKLGAECAYKKMENIHNTTDKSQKKKEEEKIFNFYIIDNQTQSNSRKKRQWHEMVPKGRERKKSTGLWGSVCVVDVHLSERSRWEASERSV